MYSRAIELYLKEVFPNRHINVFCGESVFFPGKFAVQAFVDGYGAYITIDSLEECLERCVIERLVYMIKGEMNKRYEDGQNR